MRRPACKLLTDRRRGHEFTLGFQFRKERVQSSAVELPFKRPRLSIARHRVECVTILLDAGATISAKDDDYRSTPLARAARHNLPD
jgi:hypothetical protein